jgi:hypothetical protein
LTRAIPSLALCEPGHQIILGGMKLSSKYFDSIRVSKKGAETSARSETDFPPCQWKGCEKPAPYRAPMGRGREGDYFCFCIDHVRQYNATYNYFDGMSDNEVRDFQKDAITGHRPTWKVGANAWAHGTRDGQEGKAPPNGKSANFSAWRAQKAREEPADRRRSLRPIEKKSLDALHLDGKATKDEIKAKFKELVKLHHPDANGGDRQSEDKLREIIQAYNYLKQAGLV